jgi:hypothetical protein
LILDGTIAQAESDKKEREFSQELNQINQGLVKKK